MFFLDIILKKRNGLRLSKPEIDFFISAYVKGDIPDYQVSALLMAIYFSKMDDDETANLTFGMRDSGDIIDLSNVKGIKADKHSTGGVADTTTLITAPLVAACGLKVAKMSGRGLGHTGGTLDKLESIPGVTTSISMEKFEQIVSKYGISIIGQTRELVPADKLLYALRDVTGTADNISLIAASIMSKKLASGSDIIVLDVKTGNGAFMKALKDSKELARSMVQIGKTAGKKVMALVTDMSQPLGCAIGNALEVREAIEVLRGKREGALKKVAVALASKMLLAAGLAQDDEAAKKKITRVLDSGKGLEKLAQMIEAQNGNPKVCDDVGILPQADQKITITATESGTIDGIITDQVGMSALLLGAGRTKKEDTIDPAVGIWMDVRIGDTIHKGDPIATFYVNDTKNVDEAVQRFQKSLKLEKNSNNKNPLIYETID